MFALSLLGDGSLFRRFTTIQGGTARWGRVDA
jgi:hypothetical protein